MSNYLEILNNFLNRENVNTDVILGVMIHYRNEDAAIEEIIQCILNDKKILNNAEFLASLRQYVSTRIYEDKLAEFNRYISQLEPFSRKSYEQIVTSFQPSTVSEFSKALEDVSYYAFYPPQFEVRRFQIKVTITINKEREDILRNVTCYPASRIIPQSSGVYHKNGEDKKVDYKFVVFIDTRQDLAGTPDYQKNSILSCLGMQYVNSDSLRLEQRVEPGNEKASQCFVFDTFPYFKILADKYNEYCSEIKNYVGLCYIEQTNVVLVPKFFELLMTEQNFNKSNARIEIKFLYDGKNPSVYDDFVEKIPGKILDFENARGNDNRGTFSFYTQAGKIGPLLNRIFDLMSNYCFLGLFTITNDTVSFREYLNIKSKYKVTIYYPSLDDFDVIEDALNLELSMFRSLQNKAKKFNQNEIPARFYKVQKKRKDNIFTSLYPRSCLFFIDDDKAKLFLAQDKINTNQSFCYSQASYTFDIINAFSQIKIIKDRGNRPSSLDCYIVTFNQNSNLDSIVTFNRNSNSDSTVSAPIEVHSLNETTKIYLVRGSDEPPISDDPSIVITHLNDIPQTIDDVTSAGNFVYSVNSFDDKAIVTPAMTTRFEIEMLSFENEKYRQLASMFVLDVPYSRPVFIRKVGNNLAKSNFQFAEDEKQEIVNCLKNGTSTYDWILSFIYLFYSSISKPINSTNVSYLDNEMLNILDINKDKFLRELKDRILEKTKIESTEKMLESAESDLEYELLKELIEKNTMNIEEETFQFLNSYNQIILQFDDFHDQQGQEITAKFVKLQSQKDFSVFSLFLSSIFEVINSKVKKSQVIELMELNGVSPNDYTIIELDELFLICRNPIETMLTDQGNLSFTVFIGEGKIKRGTKGSDLLHCYFKVSIDEKLENTDKLIVDVVKKHAHYENFLTGEISEINSNDLTIESFEYVCGDIEFTVFAQFNRDGSLLVADHLSYITNDTSFKLKTSFGYVIFENGYSIKEAIEEGFINSNRESFVQSMVYGFTIDNMSLDEGTRTMFFNLNCINKSVNYHQKFKIIPSNIYRVYSIISGSKNNQLMERNKTESSIMLDGMELKETAEKIRKYTGYLEISTPKNESEDYLVISNVKDEKGTIITEKFDKYANANLSVGETMTNRLRKSLINDKFNIEGDYSYIDLKNIERVNKIIDTKLEEFSSNSIRYALLKINKTEAREEQEKLYNYEKVFWTKFSQNKRIYAVGLSNNVLLYSFISGRFVQISILYHENTLDIVFGNNIHCVTISSLETKVWIMQTGTEIDIFIPYIIYNVKDKVSGISNGEVLKNVEITKFYFVDRNGNIADENEERDRNFYYMYSPVYYHQNKKIDYISSNSSQNTFFFSDDDKYMIFNYLSKLKIINMTSLEEVKITTVNGLNSSDQVEYPIEGQWFGDNFIGLTSVKNEFISLNVKNKSVVKTTINANIPSVQLNLTIEGSYRNNSDYADHYKKFNTVSSKYDAFFWIYDMFVTIVFEKVSSKGNSLIRMTTTFENFTLELEFYLSETDNHSFSKNYIYKSKKGYFKVKNFTTYVEFFLDNFYVFLKDNHVENIGLFDVKINEAAKEVESPNDDLMAILRIDRNSTFIQGNKDTIIVHSYYYNEIKSYTIINVVRGMEVIDYIISGQVTPIYDSINKEYILAHYDDNKFKTIQLKTFDNISNINDINFKKTTTSESLERLQVFVYNSILQTRYKRAEKIDIQMGIDNYPISRNLCMNRYKRYELMEISDLQYTQTSSITRGNLLIVADGKTLRILPKYVQSNKETTDFYLWILKGFIERHELKKLYSKIEIIKKNIQESFPILLFNSYPKILDDFPEVMRIDLGNYLKKYAKGKNRIEFEDPDLFPFLEALFRREDLIAFIFSQFDKLIETVENEKQVSLEYEQSEYEKKIQDLDKKFVGKMTHAKKEQKKQERKIIDEEYENRIQSFDNNKKIEEKFKEYDRKIEKLKGLLPDVPLPSSKEYSVFRNLEKIETTELRAVNRINEIVEKTKNDKETQTILSLRKIFETNGVYNGINDTNFRTMQNIKKTLKEAEKIQNFIKRLMREKTNFEEYSNISFSKLKKEFSYYVTKYYSMSDEFFRIMGQPAKVVALSSPKEFLISSSEEKANKEGMRLERLLNEYLAPEGKGTIDVLKRDVELLKRPNKKDVQTLEDIISNIVNSRKYALTGKSKLKEKETKEKNKKIRERIGIELSQVISSEILTNKGYNVIYQNLDKEIKKENLLSSKIKDPVKENSVKNLITSLEKIFNDIFVTNIDESRIIPVKIEEYPGGTIAELEYRVHVEQLKERQDEETKLELELEREMAKMTKKSEKSEELTEKMEKLQSIRARKAAYEFVLKKLQFLIQLPEYIKTLEQLNEDIILIEERKKTLKRFKSEYSFEEIVIAICKSKNLTFEEKVKELELLSDFNGEFPLSTVRFNYFDEKIKDEIENLFPEIVRRKAKEVDVEKTIGLSAKDEIKENDKEYRKQEQYQEVPEYIQMTSLEDENYDKYLVHRDRYIVIKSREFLYELLAELYEFDSFEDVIDHIKIRLLEIGNREDKREESTNMLRKILEQREEISYFDNWIKQHAYYGFYKMIENMAKKGLVSIKKMSKKLYKDTLGELGEFIMEVYCEPLEDMYKETISEMYYLTSRLPNSEKLHELISFIPLQNPSFKEIEDYIFKDIEKELSRSVQMEMSLIEPEFWKEVTLDQYQDIVNGLSNETITVEDIKFGNVDLTAFLEYITSENENRNEFVAFAGRVRSLEKTLNSKRLCEILKKRMRCQSLEDDEIDELEKLMAFDEYKKLINYKELLMNKYKIEGNAHVKTLETLIDEICSENLINSINLEQRMEIYDRLMWYKNNGNNPKAENKEIYSEFHVQSLKDEIEYYEYLLRSRQYLIEGKNTEKISKHLQYSLQEIMEKYKNSEMEMDERANINVISIEFPGEIEIFSKSSDSELGEIEIGLKKFGELENIRVLNRVAVDLTKILEDSLKSKENVKNIKVDRTKYRTAEFGKVSNESYEKARNRMFTSKVTEEFRTVMLGNSKVTNNRIITAEFNAVKFGEKYLSATASYTKELERETSETYKRIIDFDFAGLEQVSVVVAFRSPLIYEDEKYCVRIVNCMNEKKMERTIICLQNIKDGTRRLFSTKTFSYEIKNEVDMLNIEEEIMVRILRDLSPGNTITIEDKNMKHPEIEKSKTFNLGNFIVIVAHYRDGNRVGTILRAISTDQKQKFSWLLKNMIVEDVSNVKAGFFIVALNKMHKGYRFRCGVIELANKMKNLAINNFDSEYELNKTIDSLKRVKMLSKISNQSKVVFISSKQNSVIILSNKFKEIKLKEGVVDVTTTEAGNLISVNYGTRSEIYTFAGEKIREINAEATWI